MGSIQTRPFVLNALEVAKAYEIGRRNLSRKEMKIFLLVVAISVVLALSPLFLAALFLPIERTNVVNGLLTLSKWFVGFVVVLYVVFPLIFRFRIWIALKTNPNLYQKTWAVTFSDQGVDFVSNNSNSHIDWSYYQSVKESKDFFLLLAGKNVFNTLPKKALEQTQVGELRALLKEKIGKYKELF